MNCDAAIFSTVVLSAGIGTVLVQQLVALYSASKKRRWKIEDRERRGSDRDDLRRQFQALLDLSELHPEAYAAVASGVPLRALIACLDNDAKL